MSLCVFSSTVVTINSAATSRFLALSTWDASQGSDTSPRGDRREVARILDGRTLAIPDRKGNKCADSLHNLLQDERLSFAALVPGRSGVLHVRGRGTITDDPALLETMALGGMPPHLALIVDVEHAEVTGSDAVRRSRLWTPGVHLDRGTAPDMMALGGEMDRAYRYGLRKEGYDEVETRAVGPSRRPSNRA
ncbi:pyridoxamine 5'-phosphate oxidase family protein [Streptomyces sp. YIM 130001]|uniref:pyridoxamine 5'-phosphate oxidase family protein n=1 Tax=Streptomyces sp. YIM 130001 TaxID=2259644 RepID=UPI003204A018